MMREKPHPTNENQNENCCFSRVRFCPASASASPGRASGDAVKLVRGSRADQLAAAVALDMAQWWQPTVAGYLGRVSNPLICEAVTEANGKAAADNIAALKEGDMADRAAELLAGTGWLPAMLRAAWPRGTDDPAPVHSAPGPVIAREAETAPKDFE
jgi:hypothetical protein